MWFSASHRLGNYGSTCLLKDFCYWARAIVPFFMFLKSEIDEKVWRYRVKSVYLRPKTVS